jgi:hypothetical protein
LFIHAFFTPYILSNLIITRLATALVAAAAAELVKVGLFIRGLLGPSQKANLLVIPFCCVLAATISSSFLHCAVQYKKE